MGLVIHLQGERGNVHESVIDDENLLHVVLPSLDNSDYYYINRIDWYGDTYFNRGQLEDLISEMSRLRAGTTSERQRILLDSILDMAKRGTEEPHLYLRFVGD